MYSPDFEDNCVPHLQFKEDSKLWFKEFSPYNGRLKPKLILTLLMNMMRNETLVPEPSPLWRILYFQISHRQTLHNLPREFCWCVCKTESTKILCNCIISSIV